MDFNELILKELSEKKHINSLELSDNLKLDHQKIVGAIKSIQSLDNVIIVEQQQYVHWELTEEGRLVATNGSHEYVVWKNVSNEGIKQEDLSKLVGQLTFKVGFSKAMQLGWIQINKSNPSGPLVSRKVENCDDTVSLLCQKIQQLQLSELTDIEKTECKKRKLANEIKQACYDVKCGSNFSLSLEKQETELTLEMITSGSWKTKNFKKYNFDSLGQPVVSGHLHPLLKVRTQFRQIFLEMGFSEMPTNNFVESSFWNFDALFQPQQHPARDAHDTFFISDPANSLDLPMDYLNKVKQIHSFGGFGSQGYQYDWKLKEAMKNIMRTHTTGVSARMLYKLAQQDEFTPAKYFSIDRVFRNETLDMTHLAEFHQIEGLVADRGLSLANLMGYISEFFKKLGIKKLKYKPAYNPYTEPSMEIFSYHEGLKKWVEIGNSGVFRPEMLLPMGLPPDVSVIAWGLSLERPTMIKYGISNIRELFGPKIDLQKIYDNPICRLDK